MSNREKEKKEKKEKKKMHYPMAMLRVSGVG
jgi:hypothetical protein